MTRDVQHVLSVGVIIVAVVGVLAMVLLLDFPVSPVMCLK